MGHNLDKNTKALVKIIIKDQSGRDKRKSNGRYTAFDTRAQTAVEAAKDKIELQGFSNNARKHVIEKICQSLEDGTPWELLGETYCGRRLFYEYRKEFCFYVAEAMDMIDK